MYEISMPRDYEAQALCNLAMNNTNLAVVVDSFPYTSRPLYLENHHMILKKKTVAVVIGLAGQTTFIVGLQLV